jgi:homoserine/homoserine lactone efflux protein
MDLPVWLTYFIATVILSVTPGPGVFSAISSGLHNGFRRGMWNSIGMQLASLIVLVVVAVGLGAILVASETMFSIVKWIGVAYLIYLGIVTWRTRPRGFVDTDDGMVRTTREIFLHGFFVNITNPKGIIFFVAILPQFIDIARPQVAQYAILAATTVVVDLIVMAGYTALAAKVMRAMRDERHLKWINRTLGGAFVAAGVALASFRRAAVAAA